MTFIRLLKVSGFSGIYDDDYATSNIWQRHMAYLSTVASNRIPFDAYFAHKFIEKKEKNIDLTFVLTENIELNEIPLGVWPLFTFGRLISVGLKPTILK